MDQAQLFEIIDKFEESSLSELRLKWDDASIVLKKGGVDLAQAYPVHQHLGTPLMQHPQPPHPGVTAETQGVNTPAPGEGVESSDTETIISPVVGTFYRAPAPDSPPFAEEGSQVKAGSTLCVLEAMKVMNELEAEFNLEVVRVLVKNGEMVEYGTPLFEVRRI